MAVFPSLEMPSEISRRGSVTLLSYTIGLRLQGSLPDAASFFSSPGLVNERHVLGASGDADTLSCGVCRSFRPMQSVLIFYLNVLLKWSTDVSLLTFTYRQR